MSQRQEYLTKEGLARIEAELKHLKEVKRAEVAERIQRAKEIGGTQNNAEYDDAKNEQAFVEGRILELEALIKNAVLIEEHPSAGIVQVGSHVTLADEKGHKEHYIIVGSAEVNPKEGKISNESPIGKALLGKKAGQTAEVHTPAGTVKYKIVQIR